VNTSKICIFDNPAGYRREYWRDGKLVGHYTEEFLDQAGSIVKVSKKAAIHLCKFQPGRLVGDSGAMAS
jgi:hypothetical protein